MLFAGDLTNADLISPAKRVQQVKEIFSIVESFKIPYYYVWGTPFREGTLASALKKEASVFSKRQLGKIEHFLSSLSFGKHLKEEKPIKLGKYWLTSSPERIPNNAILLRHHYRKIIPRALIQLDGHLHNGQRVLNYLNLGSLYRDAAHGASPMIGCYWKLSLERSIVTTDFMNLGNRLKEFRCLDHPEEGTFYIPHYWKKCPVCFEPREALIKKN